MSCGSVLQIQCLHESSKLTKTLNNHTFSTLLGIVKKEENVYLTVSSSTKVGCSNKLSLQSAATDIT